MNSTTIKQQLTQMLASLHAAGHEFAGMFVADGMALLAALLVLSLAWILVESMLGEDIRSTVSKAVRQIIVAGFVLAALTAWKDPAGGLDISVRGLFLEGSAKLTETVGKVGGGLGAAGTCGGDVTCAVVDKMIAATNNVLGQPLAISFTQLTAGGMIDTIMPGWAYMKSLFGKEEKKDGMFSPLLAMLTSYATAAVLMFALAAYVFALNVGDVMMVVGLTFGPLLLPFLLVPRLPLFGNLAGGWFNLALSGAFYKAVAAVVGFSTLGAMDFVLSNSIAPAGTEAGKAGAGGVLMAAVTMLFFAWLLKQMLGAVSDMVRAMIGAGINSDHGSSMVGFAVGGALAGGRAAARAATKAVDVNK